MAASEPRSQIESHHRKPYCSDSWDGGAIKRLLVASAGFGAGTQILALRFVAPAGRDC